MKMKKLAPVLALALCVSALSGCTGKQQVSFNRFWQQNSLLTKEPIHETLVYDVSFESGSGLDKMGYGLSYENGVYKTVLTSEEVDGKIVYTYTTELTISATYTLGTESETVNDRVYSESKFYGAELKPISSKKEIVSHSPASGGSMLEVNDCYDAFDYTVSIDYATNKSVVTAKGETPVERSFEIDDDKYSYLDNEQILFALRGISSGVNSAKVLAYSPFAGTVQTVAWTFAQEASAKFTFEKNGEEISPTITYRPVSIVLDEKNPGATQTAWIAKTTNDQNNTYRNVMLKLQTPLSYSLGTLVYTLNSATYA